MVSAPLHLCMCNSASAPDEDYISDRNFLLSLLLLIIVIIISIIGVCVRERESVWGSMFVVYVLVSVCTVYVCMCALDARCQH